MNVMSDSSVAPIYCGTISTPKPELNESVSCGIIIFVTYQSKIHEGEED